MQNSKYRAKPALEVCFSLKVAALDEYLFRKGFHLLASINKHGIRA